jgi:acyl-coenzyme A synthetase/AMP-(fatty) acid ligase/acyl carrier protein
MWELLPFGPNDVCCQKTAVSFVDSVWEIFGPLLHGVKNVIIPDDVLADPVRFVETLSANSVTRIVLVPSLLRVLLDTDIDLNDKVPKLSIWICSGETLPADLLRRFHDRLSRRTMLNLYGSSEVAADATWYSTTPDRQAERVPIGRPIANTQTYVLDANRELVPVGVPGELFVGGDGLARGYLRRPELTADRFVPNRFSVESGAYLFRTGDRARYSADGNLEFLGRTDFQVKLRGFRIELGEIEAALVRQPQVREAVAQLREDTLGDPRLVAYVVTQGEPLAAAELRAALKQQLPDYMIPVAFAQLPALPLTPNGKIDRKALPAPERENSEVEYRAPRTPMEKALADIWTEVLNLPRVGIDDNFFDLGGHSLLAVRLMSRIRFDLNIDMSMRQLFETPTVSGLALAALDNIAQYATDRPLSPRA